MKTIYGIAQFAMLSAVIVILSSCGGRSTGNDVAQDIEPLACVALLPTTTHYDENAMNGQDREALSEGAAFLYEQIKMQLERTTVPQIIEVADLKDQIEEVAGGKLGAVKTIGQKARCGAVLVSTLHRYSQRHGGEYAVDDPASAAFELRLIEAHSGKGLWVTSFNETQKSLMSNLFSFSKAQSRGFKWITVEDLVAQGVAEKIEECPYFN